MAWLPGAASRSSEAQAQRYFPLDPIGRGVSVRAMSLGEQPWPPTPVPESNTVAILATLLLAGVAARRIRNG